MCLLLSVVTDFWISEIVSECTSLTYRCFSALFSFVRLWLSELL